MTFDSIESKDEVHFVDGRFLNAKIISHSCPCKRASYVPVDHDDFRAVVIFTKGHNHPSFAPHKISEDVRSSARAAVDAYGTGPLTAGQLNNGELSISICFFRWC